MRFKSKLVCTLFVLLIVQACKKTKTEVYTGTVVFRGYDMRLCACCGGPLVSLGDTVAPNSSKFYMLNNPDDLGITGQSQPPIYFDADWKVDTTRRPCITNPRITVTRFRKRN